MNPQNASDLTLQETWVSAFVDGEVTVSEQADWNTGVHEQLYYYTITRQVLRGEPMSSPQHSDFQTQRATWVAFWARVDAV